MTTERPEGTSPLRRWWPWAPLNPPLTEWSGRVVWIVGASSGIGLATAEALVAQGAWVAVSARQAQVLTDWAAAQPQALAVPLDVCEPGALAAGCEQVLARWGRLDMTLYCAGHYRPLRADAWDAGSLQEALRHQDINLGGVWRWLDAVLPVLQRQGHGHLSVVASVAAYRGLPRALAYGPTKAALNSLAQSLWLDLRQHGLGVSVVNPGFVATPLTAANDHPMPALLTPVQAAEAMLEGWAQGVFDIHFPKRFSRVMKALGVLGQCSDRLGFGVVRRVTGG